MKKELDLDYLEEILKTNTFKTLQELATTLKVSKPTLRRLLIEKNLPTKLCNLSYYFKLKELNIPIDKKWIEDNYKNTNKSLYDLEKELGLPKRFLEKLCILTNTHKKYKYSFNRSKLYNINDPNVWYLAGLIATDGCLDRFANRISIGLVGEDEEDLLKSISEYFEDSRGVFHIYRKSKDKEKVYYTSNICFSDKNLKQFFKDNFNIYYTDELSKTFSLGFPDNFPSDEHKKAFVLGCFDGDGCITHLNCKHPTAGLLTASRDFVFGLSSLLENELDIDTHFIETKYYSISIGVKDGLEKFLDWMYSYNGFKLKRKYERYLKVKDIVCSTVKAK
jgi:hypothetical protein